MRSRQCRRWWGRARRIAWRQDHHGLSRKRRHAVRLAHRRGAPVRCRAWKAARDRRCVDDHCDSHVGVSGLATRLLARDDAKDLAILGAGVLALPHIEAVRCVRDIKRVRVWSRSGDRATELVARARKQFDLDGERCGECARGGRGGGCDLHDYGGAHPGARGRVDRRRCARERRRRVDSHRPRTRHRRCPYARDSLSIAASPRSTRPEIFSFRAVRARSRTPTSSRARRPARRTREGPREPRRHHLFKSLGLAVEDVASLATSIRRPSRRVRERASRSGTSRSLSGGDDSGGRGVRLNGCMRCFPDA